MKRNSFLLFVLAAILLILSGCGNKVGLAEIAGFSGEPENYAVDIDGDGIEELVINCVSEGDGHEEVYVYKYEEDETVVGFVNWLDLDLPGLNYWGVNAVQTHYDNECGKIFVKYYDTNESVDKYIPVEFDKLKFNQWDEGDELPFIDIDEAFELFG